MTRTKHESCGCDRYANGALIDQAAAGLMTCAQEGVRRTANPQAFLAGQVQHLAGIIQVDGERFFIVDGFTRLKGSQCNFSMRSRRGDVEE
jgi:hypothetical protein